MNYQEAREYLDNMNRYGSVLGLESIKNLLDRLGNPQRELKFVHIAGTNGKGSVLAFLSSVLKSAGYRTGSYISPSVFSYREKIQVNGEWIDKESLARLTGQIKEACEAMEAEGFSHPTIFEAETAMAFLYFVQERCDIVVLETGLGGLLDATNCIDTAEAAVLTSISMDHMGILGNTLSEIAQQKAGIIKKGCRVISMKQEHEAMEAVKRTAKEKRAALTTADTARLKEVIYGLDRQSFTYTSERGIVYENIAITQAGTYQIENAMLALEVIEALSDAGFSVSDQELREGLLKMQWPGRFSVIERKPLVILDGAHNKDGARRLAQSVNMYLKGKRIICIMGVFADKDYEAIASQTAPLAEQVITIQTPDHARALDAEVLMQTVKNYNPNTICAGSIEEAVQTARQEADEDSAIVAFGSLSHLRALYQAFQR